MTNNMVSRGNYSYGAMSDKPRSSTMGVGKSDNYSFGETKLLHNMFIHTTKAKKYE